MIIDRLSSVIRRKIMFFCEISTSFRENRESQKMDGWLDGWIVGWMDGFMSERVLVIERLKK
jgi:hypothetical protein